MVRAASVSFLGFVLLLAACSRTPEVSTPNAALTRVSTDLTDAALEVASDAQGNAHTLGYRNYAVDLTTGQVSRPAELFVSQLGAGGALNWLTTLTTLQGAQVDDSTAFELAVTDTAIYALTQSELHGPVQLHKLGLEGTLLWSRVVLGARSAFSLIATPSGGLYFVRGAEGEDAFISALDAEGAVRWEQAVPDVYRMAPSADGGVYAVTRRSTLQGDGSILQYETLQRYSGSGALLWSQDIEPSIPYVNNDTVGPWSDVVARGDSLYLVTSFSQDLPDRQGEQWNLEVKRYNADGDELWSRLLYATEAGARNPGRFPNKFVDFPVGVSSEGDLYLLTVETDVGQGGDSDARAYTQRLYRFFPDGQRTEAGLQTYSDTVTDAALAPVPVTDRYGASNPTFYTVSTHNEDLAACSSAMQLRGPCVDTDIVTSLYTVDGSADRVQMPVQLQWGTR